MKTRCWSRCRSLKTAPLLFFFVLASGRDKRRPRTRRARTNPAAKRQKNKKLVETRCGSAVLAFKRLSQGDREGQDCSKSFAENRRRERVCTLVSRANQSRRLLFPLFTIGQEPRSDDYNAVLTHRGGANDCLLHTERKGYIFTPFVTYNHPKTPVRRIAH